MHGVALGTVAAHGRCAMMGRVKAPDGLRCGRRQGGRASACGEVRAIPADGGRGVAQGDLAKPGATPASVWRNRNLVILVSGQWVSQIGNNLFELAVFWYVLAATHQAADLGWVGTAMALPGVLGLATGVFVDRMDRRWTMFGSDVVRAALSALLGLLALAHVLPLWLFLLLVLALMAVGTFFGPAARALLPQIVPSEQLASANGVYASAQNSAQLVGLFGGGAIMALLGPVLLFFLNSGSFVVSVVSLVFMRVPRPASANGRRGGDMGQLYTEWLEGFQLYRSITLLRAFLFTALAINFAGQGLDVLAAAWVQGSLHGGAFTYALFGGAITIGAIMGSLGTGVVLRRIPLERALFLGTVAIGALVVLLSRIPLLWVTLATMLLGGVAMGVINTGLTTKMQSIVPQEKMGRVFGTLNAMVTLANPLGAAVAGALATVWSVGFIYLLIGCLILLGSLPLLRLRPADSATAAA